MNTDPGLWFPETDGEEHPLVSWAKGEIGEEEETGANDGARILEYLTLPGHPSPEAETGQNWCAAFVLRGLFEIGRPFHDSPEDFYACRRVTTFIRALKRRSNYRGRDYRARPGDLVLLKKPDHVGIVIGETPAGFYITIEGNRGDSVSRGTISPLHGRILGFARL